MQLPKTGLGKRILYFPLTRILIGIIVVVGVVSLGQFGLATLLGASVLEKNLMNLLFALCTALLSLAAYRLVFGFYERRKVSEISLNGSGKQICGGILLGALLQSMTILVIYISGGYTVTAVNSVTWLLPALAMSVSAAIFEEVLVRGVIFRILEERLGSYIALVISALIFGAMHLGNPNSTFIAALGLALQAGLFLAAAYMFTRNLWFPIATHFAWNFTQGGIFGASVSGNSVNRSLLTPRIEGHDWLTGGGFGPEGSVQATVFCFAATLILLYLCRKQNKIIIPYWKKHAAPNGH
jgi:uncharacterized protein